jgi:hypothetical protein
MTIITHRIYREVEAAARPVTIEEQTGGSEMTDIEMTIYALEHGILPSFNSEEIDKLLQTLDDDECRIMKRRFRKLWRRARATAVKHAQTTCEASLIFDSFQSPARRRGAVRQSIVDTKF